jgi:hypothetical protein
MYWSENNWELEEKKISFLFYLPDSEFWVIVLQNRILHHGVSVLRLADIQKFHLRA